MSSRASRRRRNSAATERINVYAAGIYIGASSHLVAVSEDRDEKPVREFAAYTADDGIDRGLLDRAGGGRPVVLKCLYPE